MDRVPDSCCDEVSVTEYEWASIEVRNLESVCKDEVHLPLWHAGYMLSSEWQEENIAIESVQKRREYIPVALKKFPPYIPIL